MDIDHPLAHGGVDQVMLEAESALGLAPQQVELGIGETAG
jgi:hypothetical protein